MIHFDYQWFCKNPTFHGGFLASGGLFPQNKETHIPLKPEHQWGTWVKGGRKKPTTYPMLPHLPATAVLVLGRAQKAFWGVLGDLSLTVINNSLRSSLDLNSLWSIVWSIIFQICWETENFVSYCLRSLRRLFKWSWVLQDVLRISWGRGQCGGSHMSLICPGHNGVGLLMMSTCHFLHQRWNLRCWNANSSSTSLSLDKAINVFSVQQQRSQTLNPMDHLLM